MAWWQAAAAIGSALLSNRGARDANTANAAEAEKNRRFQERMSSTAYQRAAKDLQAAGLNRILALGSPASTPGGAQATMQDAITPAVHTGMAAKRMFAEIENIKANTEKLRSEKNLTDTKDRTMQGAGTLMDDAVDLYNAGKDVLQKEAGTWIDKGVQGVSSTAKAAKKNWDSLWKDEPKKKREIKKQISFKERKQRIYSLDQARKRKFSDTSPRYLKLDNGKWFDLKTRKVKEIR